MKINIFKENKPEIDLPTFIDSRALICANSGGGKSYAVRKILEESNDKVMAIVLDVEGEFKTLREKYKFLLIGEGCDVELSMQAAKLLPQKILEEEVSTIIDISDLKKSERIKYVKDFLESLMQLKRDLWKPTVVVIDEAHLLCGQQEKQDSCGAVIDLMTRGRKRGFCGVLCTQRISKLHKDAVAEANNIMIGRTGLDIDMKRASEILGFCNKQDMLSLRDLAPGEFFVFGTAMTRHVTKAKIGEVKTVHPRPGMDLRKTVAEPTAEITKMLSSLNDLPKEEEKKKKEVQDYQKEIVDLKHQVRVAENSRPKEQIVKEIIKIDEEKLNQAKLEGFNEAKEKYKSYVTSIESNTKLLIKPLQKIMNDAGGILKSKAFSLVSDTPTYTPTPSKIKSGSRTNIQNRENVILKKPVQNFNRPEPVKTNFNNGDMNLGLCEKKLYSLLYEYPERTFSKPQMGVFTGYSYKSGGFNNALCRLRQMELIEGSGNNLRVSSMNPELVGQFDFSKEAMISKLGKCEREIYEVLLRNPGSEFVKEELALNTETQYSSGSGGFNNALCRLNTLGLIERFDGMVKINPELLEL